MSDARKSNRGVMAETPIGTVWYNMSLNNISDGAILRSSGDISQFRSLPTATPPNIAEKMAQFRKRSKNFF